MFNISNQIAIATKNNKNRLLKYTSAEIKNVLYYKMIACVFLFAFLTI